jgi:hypothetical protein
VIVRGNVRVLWVAAALALGVSACGNPIAQSHVDANVPAPDQFDVLLRRDLHAFFHVARGEEVTVDYELLRHDPTQAGVAHPKYYLWVRVRNSSGAAVDEGAVRVAAVDRKRFDVTHFMSKRDIRSNPDAVEQVFPKALADGIRSRAEATP